MSKRSSGLLSLAATLLVAACGGGGDAQPAGPYAVNAALGHLLGSGGSWTMSGSASGQPFTLTMAFAPAPAGLFPVNGVFAAHVNTGEKNFRAVLNIGHRPTLTKPTPELRVEVHLLDFAGDLYGQELEVAFTAKLRDEKKFASLDALKAQIAHDIAEAKLRF